MLPCNDPDRIHVAFDDHRLVANAGLILPVTLAQHLGLGLLIAVAASAVLMGLTSCFARL